MSWLTVIESDKPITIDDVTKALAAMKDEFGGPAGGARQSWGWSAVCDVSMHEGKLEIGGADFSFKHAAGFTARLIEELKKLGYTAKIECEHPPLSAGEKSAHAAASDYQKTLAHRARRH
jgi:peptidoglycan/xylan/chitin deacetylase (PgdA/CDA1 family)